LAEAREQARKLALEAKGGVNLLARKRAQRSALIAAASKNKTFTDCAEAYMDASSIRAAGQGGASPQGSGF
jgi:hypothetical protein